jgi:hypothetical protein
MTSQVAKEQIVALKEQYTEGMTSFPIIGFCTYWNMRNVDITMDQFAQLLKDHGFKEKYAKEHNYRSAFIRALRNMEEQRIIRRVEETPHHLVYQFTAEHKEGHGQDATLSYDPETCVVIDKEVYRKTRDFSQAIVQGKSDIKTKVLEHFMREKTRYHSADVTRYIQNILADNADVCSIREQGCLYFVPAVYRSVLDRLISMINKMGSSRMEFMPMPDVGPNRQVVGNAFCKELDSLFANIEQEIAEVALGKEVGETWADTKASKIAAIKKRIALYSDVLSTRAEHYGQNFDTLLTKIRPNRELDLGDVGDVEKKESA